MRRYLSVSQCRIVVEIVRFDQWSVLAIGAWGRDLVECDCCDMLQEQAVGLRRVEGSRGVEGSRRPKLMQRGQWEG
jgi:hypothetical protein